MNPLPTKADVHEVLDSLSVNLSTSIGYISNALFSLQSELDISSEDIISIITSLAVVRDEIDEKVVKIKNIMDARPANGQDPSL
jgi:hypothetical protein